MGCARTTPISSFARARALEVPARYVSGYLMMDDRVDQEATHAWAEAFVEGLGWVGFDISNGISPDPRYVRVATGRDYPMPRRSPGSALARCAKSCMWHWRLNSSR